MPKLSCFYFYILHACLRIPPLPQGHEDILKYYFIKVLEFCFYSHFFLLVWDGGSMFCCVFVWLTIVPASLWNISLFPISIVHSVLDRVSMDLFLGFLICSQVLFVDTCTKRPLCSEVPISDETSLFINGLGPLLFRCKFRISLHRMENSWNFYWDYIEPVHQFEGN